MKKAKVFAQLFLLIIVSVFSFPGVMHAACAGTTSWSGSITSADNVTNENITLDSATITIDDDGVHVRATDCDINVTMMSDVVIEGSGAARLYLEVHDGHTITFCIDNDLTFKNSMLILARGDGTVIFEVQGEQKLSFSPSDMDASAAVKFYACMQDTLQVCFTRKAGNEDENAQICVGTNCVLGYLAEDGPQTSTEVGCIKWNPTNGVDDGRLILNIANLGLVLVRGCQTDDCNKTELLLGDIDCSVLAGQDAVMKIENSVGNSANAGLLIVNSNETWPELLVDPFCNLGTRDDMVDYNGTFSGVQYGFILGANATFTVLENAYLDYVGLTGTVCVNIPNDEVLSSMLKPRTPSAFIIDGSNDPASTPAKISIANQAAIYFRSGVDRFGNVRPITDPNPFTIDPLFRTTGAGLTVLHIEGQLDVCGANLDATSPSGMQSMMEVLSLEVSHTGGPLFVGTSETIFPLRTFAQDGMGQLFQYNAANIMVNNCWNLYNTALKHTDEIHNVFEKNDACSEPTYIGGETAVIKSALFKERLSFYNSVLLVHTDVAFTGFDLSIPNGFDPVTTECVDNLSRFYFFQNGKRIDQGTGRQMILGTVIGSTACDGCSVVCCDAHLDVMQTSTCAGGSSLIEELQLKVQANNDTINDQITGDITGQTSIHTIYLGKNSNISVGTNDSNNSNMGTDKHGNRFTLTTLPKFTICGNFFSFETKGGSLGLPSTSSVTGQGGIFVDENGTFCLADTYRAYFGAMITKSSNGIISISKECSLFESCVGIADWNLNLANQQIIVPVNTCLSDYTLNWMFVQKDYDGGFCPYEITDCGGCGCAPVLDDNVYNLPEIRGTVDQLQIKGSRFGDQAHVLINGGLVRELVHCVGFNSAEAPVAVVVLDDGGRVGIGSASKNSDSLRAHSKLGVNGVTIIANGGGIVELNDNLIIDNMCSILAGPGFATGGALRIGSTQGKVLTIKSTGVLDLRSFTANQAIEFFGDLEVVLEPGARILFGGDADTSGCTVRFKGNSKLLFEPAVNPYILDSMVDLPESTLDFAASCIDNPLTSLTQSDDRRVIISGRGTIVIENASRVSIPRGASLGIETYEACSIDLTNISLEIKNSGHVIIGDERIDGFGGTLQVGNVTDHSGGSVSFRLILNGDDATFEIGAQGFLGFAVGCACKLFTAPNNWEVAPLYNVTNIGISFPSNGIFKAPHIWSGDDDMASLFAISEGASSTPVVYDVMVSPITDEDGHLSRTSILGGSNLVNIVGSAGIIRPVVLNIDGEIDANYSASLLASTRSIIGVTPVGTTAADVFAFLKLKDIAAFQPVTGKATAAQNQRNHKELNAGWVSDGMIGRQAFENMISSGGKLTAQEHTRQTGSISIGLAPGVAAPGQLQYAIENP